MLTSKDIIEMHKEQCVRALDEPSQMPLLFSQRSRLVKQFESWAENVHAEKHPLNMLAFLDLHGLIDVAAAKSLLNREVPNA